MKKISVGIVIPVFNVERYLCECLDSVVNQTETPDEVILVNDGSTDNSRQICEEYCKKYEHFFLISQENRGLAAARNTGVNICTSSYILFVDSDDFIHVDLVKRIRQTIQVNQYDVLMFSAQVQYDIHNGEARNAYIRMENYNGKCLTGKYYLEKTYPMRYMESACLAVYRMDFLLKKDIYFPDGIFFEDSLFTLKVLLGAETVFSIPEILYTRRCRDGSIISQGIDVRKAKDLIILNHQIWSVLEDYGIKNLDKRFLMDYVSGNLLHVWNKTSLLSQVKGCQEELGELFQKFLLIWEGIYAESGRNIGDSAALYLAIREWRKISEFTLQKEIENALILKLRHLPFNSKDRKVIVYGIGVNARALINLYQNLIGDVECIMEYMITDSGGREITFGGNKVLNCSDLSTHPFDMIVISSRAYQEDMLEELRSRNIAEDKIVTLYDETDVCDLSVIWGVLDRIKGR